MKQKIAITALASLSALGQDTEIIWDNYLKDSSFIGKQTIGNHKIPVAMLPISVKEAIETLRISESKYKNLDDSVLMAMYASRMLLQKTNWEKEAVFGINIGSSRGATQLFEKYHQEFLTTGKTSTLASPTTTLGNIASWVAHDLKSKGPEISHSITCSTALHALLNGIVWLESGRCDKFIVGGSEAPLTPFTMAQMQALKIYASGDECRALDLDKNKNTMVLGEGVAMIAIEIGTKSNALAYVEGIGYATDVLEHNISISAEAICFQDSMKMALGATNPNTVDAIVMHAPGTIKGDLSEFKAIQKIFGKADADSFPLLTTNKWKIGHTFGASGMLSVELALLMLQHDTFIPVPYYNNITTNKTIKKVMVNAVGFGGNAVSVLLVKE